MTISRAHSTLVGATSGMEPVSLSTVLSVADLQTRVDRKYLLTPEEFNRLQHDLPERFSVLQIGPIRIFDYESIYFDTPQLHLHHDLRRGRPKRYTVRTRTYLDSGECLFEVKVKGARGQSIKHRMPYSMDRRHLIDSSAQDFLGEVLHNEFEWAPPHLDPVMTTRYRRGTLVDLDDGARLTCDVDLECIGRSKSVIGPDRIIVESKTTGRGAADTMLAALGTRPISISKYGVGTALLSPDLPANRWSRILRHEFGWSRELHAAA